MSVIDGTNVVNDDGKMSGFDASNGNHWVIDEVPYKFPELEYVLALL